LQRSKRVYAWDGQGVQDRRLISAAEKSAWESAKPIFDLRI
jgi:hypothetical protein